MKAPILYQPPRQEEIPHAANMISLVLGQTRQDRRRDDDGIGNHLFLGDRRDSACERQQNVCGIFPQYIHGAKLRKKYHFYSISYIFNDSCDRFLGFLCNFAAMPDVALAIETLMQ